MCATTQRRMHSVHRHRQASSRTRVLTNLPFLAGLYAAVLLVHDPRQSVVLQQQKAPRWQADGRQWLSVSRGWAKWSLGSSTGPTHAITVRLPPHHPLG